VSAARIALVDSGVANLGSVQAALARIGHDVAPTVDAERIRAASHVILPGVGNAAAAMRSLRERGLDRVLPELRQPVLGICLGMQLLFESTEESATVCLGVIPGRVRKLSAERCKRVPHMGWNNLEALGASPLLAGFGGEPFAYFVHSYAVDVDTRTVASSDCGQPFAAIVAHRNFVGAQFHPERSAGVGSALLRNFLSQ
jgi:glutamine amidotransferase